MKTVLVMGGTTYFGKRLVRYLLKAGCNVTIATRGKTNLPYRDQVQHIQFDRTCLASMTQRFSGKQYDIVFDQIAFCSDEVASVCKVFSGNIGHYVFTSSVAVYLTSPGLGKVETDFDPLGVHCVEGRYPKQVGYVTGKQQAEAYLAQNATFPFAFARIPMVMGMGDPTERLGFLVKRILNKKPIVIPPDCGQMNFVESDDAGRFLVWLGATSRTGIYNAGSDSWIKPAEMTELAGKILGIEPIIHHQGRNSHRTEFAYECDLTVDVSKAKRDGFEFTSFDQWFPRIVKETAQMIIENPYKQWSLKTVKASAKTIIKSVINKK